MVCNQHLVNSSRFVFDQLLLFCGAILLLWVIVYLKVLSQRKLDFLFFSLPGHLWLITSHNVVFPVLNWYYVQAQKELLDAELDLYKKTQAGEDTALLKIKYTQLQIEVLTWPRKKTVPQDWYQVLKCYLIPPLESTHDPCNSKWSVGSLFTTSLNPCFKLSARYLCSIWLPFISEICFNPGSQKGTPVTRKRPGGPHPGPRCSQGPGTGHQRTGKRCASACSRGPSTTGTWDFRLHWDRPCGPASTLCCKSA